MITTYATVVGIDPSLTSTGIAVIRPNRVVETMRTGRDGHRGETILQRHQRIKETRRDLRNWIRLDDHTLVVIEGPSHGHKRQGGEFDRHWLWGQLVSMLLDADVDVAICPPTVRAKWATNNGNADKTVVTAAARHRFGRDFATDDEADAAVLAGMGAHAIGWRDREPDFAHKALCSVEWPADVAELVLEPYRRPFVEVAR